MLSENRWEGSAYKNNIRGILWASKLGFEGVFCFLPKERHKEGHVSRGYILSQGTKA